MSEYYPPGAYNGDYRECEVDYECPNCGRTWQASAIYEFGHTELLNEDDSQCPDCGEEGDVV